MKTHRLHTAKRMPSDNGFSMYKISFDSSPEWMAMRKFIVAGAVDNIIISELSFLSSDKYDYYLPVRKIGRFRMVGFKSKKDAMAFLLRFGSYPEVIIWDTKIQFIEYEIVYSED